jgi:hypothetical protein
MKPKPKIQPLTPAAAGARATLSSPRAEDIPALSSDVDGGGRNRH